MILLFSDFGSSDLYAGQVRQVLHRDAPGIPVVDLLNDAPAFRVAAAAHLLAALAARVDPADVVLAVVDPGVGTARQAVALRSRGHWLVGPDNGLLSVLAARDGCEGVWRLPEPPPGISATFHGRDVFAPFAARLARGVVAELELESTVLRVDLGADELAEVIFVDHYGSAVTGLRTGSTSAVLSAGGNRLTRARTFADVAPGTPAWIVNSLGLVEIVVNQGSAAGLLGLRIGDRVSWS